MAGTKVEAKGGAKLKLGLRAKGLGLRAGGAMEGGGFGVKLGLRA